MAHYRLESEWISTAPIEAVFDLLNRPQDFEDWWPAVKSSRLLSEGDASGIGARAEYSLRGPFRYGMDFSTKAVEIDAPRRIRSLIRGDLVGTASYELDDDDGTRVRLTWRVSTNKSWMNRLAPLARPLLVWTHHYVMRQGAAAMAARLGAQLISAESSLEDESGAQQNLAVSS